MNNNKEKFFYAQPYNTKHSITEKNKETYKKRLTNQIEADIIKEKLNKERRKAK